MIDIDHQAVRLSYRLTRFLKMVRQYGRLATAHQSARRRQDPRGFSELFLLGRLGLTVEHHVLLAQYAPLFTVGKAPRLRSRVRSYCQRQTAGGRPIESAASSIASPTSSTR